jgi:hypothetical protein
LWHTPNAADAWVPTTISENTMRRGDPDGPLRTSSGSLAKQAANPEFWPTPQAHDVHPGRPERVGRHGTKYGGRDLTDWVAMWPTPRANERQQYNSRDSYVALSLAVKDGTGGQLNPAWVEWLMGYPPGWTDCGDSGTPSSPRSPSTSDG